MDKFQYIYLLPPIEKHYDFIKISFCIFKVPKPSMKSGYAKDLSSVNTKSNLCICILILTNIAKLTRGFKCYVEIEEFNIMSYFVSNNLIL